MQPEDDFDEADAWFNQRYDDLIFSEHEQDHPNSDPERCTWCKAVNDGRIISDRDAIEPGS